ncbi:MAG: phospholipase D-like domain-containing protein [Chloroflexi bacterium]|nr:phospholipase D-like domain-containing protein [Chloroflexota bacterium]
MNTETIHRHSSRRNPLDKSFFTAKLQNALCYDRIAGYFSSSLLEIIGEEIDKIAGKIRVVCNSDLHPLDVQTAKAAKMGLWKSWAGSQPEALLDDIGAPLAQARFQKLYELLCSGKLEVRVLPDEVFGLIHGKAGVITLADGSKTSFIGSTNESKSAWKLNYELVWEDSSPEAVAWVQEEFDVLWCHPQAIPLSDAVIQDFGRLAHRQVLRNLDDWTVEPNPASAIIETPVYRKELGLWEHQKYFVKTAFDAHRSPIGKARFVLADQVGLGKTIQLAMAAQLMALTGNKPILIICPKTLVSQWQTEMLDLLDLPSAVWDGRHWVDEHRIEYPNFGIDTIRRCPRRIGIVSTGLIIRGSETIWPLLHMDYDCVILDEAHHARRKNLGPTHDQENPDPNNLMEFMYQVSPRTRSLLLATATPVQLRPIEAWDLLDLLNRGDESVLGNQHSYWQDAPRALALVIGQEKLPDEEYEKWEWTRNPLPPVSEGHDFEIIRRKLSVPDGEAVVFGDHYLHFGPPDLARLNKLFPHLIHEHNPFIRRIIRRTRDQLEKEIDPETHEPLIKPIKVELFGEEEEDAILLPPYLREAYGNAEEFCEILGQRIKGSGFLKTLLLRRVGSSIYAGMETARRMLENWEDAGESEEEDELENGDNEAKNTGESASVDEGKKSKTLTENERNLLEHFIAALEANQERDPKYAVVVSCLKNRHWLEAGCIIFSQYRDSIWRLAEYLTEEFPNEQIALYSGPTTSGIMLNHSWTPVSREVIKARVMSGELHLLLGTDAASEGLNLQRLATLINLDLPWNPTRLEQRKGRIQRIGQVNDTVKIYNLRYKDSVEDRVHELLSSRLQDIYSMFGQIPDVLEDAWVALALGEKAEAEKIIDALPEEHPFEIRYTKVEKVDWESCAKVLSAEEKKRVLSEGWVSANHKITQP